MGCKLLLVVVREANGHYLVVLLDRALLQGPRSCYGGCLVSGQVSDDLLLDVFSLHEGASKFFMLCVGWLGRAPLGWSKGSLLVV